MLSTAPAAASPRFPFVVSVPLVVGDDGGAAGALGRPVGRWELVIVKVLPR
jgi:hypothetical protein